MKVQVKVGGSEGTLQNPFVALWASDGTTQLACQNYQGASVDIETDYYGLTAGQTYYISVDNFVGTGYRGTFKLCLSDVPDYNFYEGALDVTSLINACSADAAYTTLNATADKSAASCWSNGPNYNRWFKFTASASGYIKAKVKVGGTEGTLQNPFVALWATNGTTLLNCENYQGASLDIETDYYGLTPGQTYYISVDNFNGAGYRGTFTLCLEDQPDYNYYEGATDVTGMINGCSADAEYTTLNATADRIAGSCWSNGPNNNRWFKFTATSTQYIRIQVKVGGTEGTMQNPFVALYNSTLSTQLNCQNYQGASTDIETDYFGLTAGQTYYIEVDNFSGSGYRGTFTLCLYDQPDYNYYEGATVLSNLNNWCSNNAEYTTLNATADKNKGSCWSNGPNYNRWFKFVAQYTSATIQVKVGGAEGSMQNPFLALWAADGTTQIACTNYAGASVDISLATAALTIGNTYYISVDNFTGTGYRGTFTLCINNVNPTTYYSTTSGDWNTVGVWSNLGYGMAACATTPTTGHIVNIRDHAITISGTSQCAEVNLSASSNTTSLTINSASLNISGKLIVSNASNFDINTRVQGTGALAVGNDATFTRSGGTGAIDFALSNSASANIGRDLIWTSTAGTSSINSMNLSNNASLTTTRDLTLSSSGGMKISFNFNSSSILNIGRDLTFTASAAAMTEAIFNNSSALNIKRNIVRGATPYGILTFNNSSTLTFNGTSNQQIIPGSAGSGGDAITFKNVILNNTSGFANDFTMGGAATINGTLTLTKGVVQTTSANYIYLPAGPTSTTIGSSNCYINGPIKIDLASSTAGTIINFPIGKGTNYLPAVLTVTHTDATPVTYTAELINSSANALGYTFPGTVNKVSLMRYWQIDRQSVANLSTATVRLYYGAFDGVTDYTNLTVVKNVGSGTTWFDIGGTATGNGTGTITSGAFSTFSRFTLGNKLAGINPLPVEFLSFMAKPFSNRVGLNWQTASETNNDFFTVEKSSDGSTFESITEVDGAGNSNSILNYSANDFSPFDGVSYYRIKQTDFNGDAKYSNIVSVDYLSDSKLDFDINPNPVTDDYLNLNMQVSKGSEVFFVLRDLTGKEIGSKIFVSDSNGNNSIKFMPTVKLEPGVYFITATSDKSTISKKIAVQ